MAMRMISFIQKFIIIAYRNINTVFVEFVAGQSIYKFSSALKVLAMGLPLFFISCVGGPKAPVESPTQGNIRIISDESFQPLIDTEVSTFCALYQNAKIKPVYKSEYDLINDFMNDSVKVIVTSKRLSDDQIKYLRDTLVIARTVTFAYDALALVINKDNNDTLFKYKDVKDIFLGNISAWKDLNSKSRLGDIRVVFDNTKSGNIRYFKELFDIQGSLPGNFFAVNNNAEVINFVSRNPDALGIVSANWISDKDDQISMELKKKIKIVAISQQMSTDNSYCRPDQGFIYDKEYPFVREVFMISRETFAGLGSGFVQWATAEQGQRIVLKSGLVPATMPIRLVKVKH